jgi:chromosome partitioning protein
VTLARHDIPYKIYVRHIYRIRSTMVSIICFGNQKGGSAKTTSAINIGASLAAEGRKTLICDLDPQGSCSLGLGVDSYQLPVTMYEVLCKDTRPDDAIVQTAIDNLALLPSNISLSAAEFELISAIRREEIFKQKITTVASNYDFVVCDLPPSLGILTINGLAASNQLIVPVECEFYAMAGIKTMLQLRDLVTTRLGHSVETRFLLTKYDSRTRLSAEVEDMVRKNFGDAVFTNLIPRAIRVAEAPSHGSPVTQYAPTSKASIAYRKLVKEEILRIVG